MCVCVYVLEHGQRLDRFACQLRLLRRNCEKGVHCCCCCCHRRRRLLPLSVPYAQPQNWPNERCRACYVLIAVMQARSHKWEANAVVGSAWQGLQYTLYIRCDNVPIGNKRAVQFVVGNRSIPSERARLLAAFYGVFKQTHFPHSALARFGCGQ